MIIHYGPIEDTIMRLVAKNLLTPTHFCSSFYDYFQINANLFLLGVLEPGEAKFKPGINELSETPFSSTVPVLNSSLSSTKVLP